jgi:hypothetical protein
MVLLRADIATGFAVGVPNNQTFFSETRIREAGVPCSVIKEGEPRRGAQLVVVYLKRYNKNSLVPSPQPQQLTSATPHDEDCATGLT